MSFVFEPVSDRVGDLICGLFGIGPSDVAVLLAMPEVHRDVDIGKAEVPRVQVDIGLPDEGAGAVLHCITKALGNRVEVAGILKGGLIAGSQEADEVPQRKIVLMFGCEVSTETEHQAESDRTDSTDSDQNAIDPEKVFAAELTDGVGSADDLRAENAVRNESGACERIGATSGDADDVEPVPSEVIGEFLHDGWPVEEFAFGLVIGLAKSWAIRANQADTLL